MGNRVRKGNHRAWRNECLSGLLVVTAINRDKDKLGNGDKECIWEMWDVRSCKEYINASGFLLIPEDGYSASLLARL